MPEVLCLPSYPVFFLGATRPSKLLQHLHRAGDSQLPSVSASASGHPRSLQAPAARHRGLHDLREHQSVARCAHPPVQAYEHLPYRTQ